MRFRIERIQDERESISLRREWQELHESVEPRNPFGSPLWNTLWWKYFSKSSFGVRHEHFVHTVRDETGKLRAVVPWAIKYRPAIGPFHLKILTTFGADRSLTEIRGVICRKEDEAEIIAALELYLRQSEMSFDAIEWAGVQTCEALDVLEAGGQLAFGSVEQVYLLSLPKTLEQLRRTLSPNLRKNLRRSEERLKSSSLTLKLRVSAEAREVDLCMARFFKLHSMRANAKNMVVHPDKFTDTVNRNFIHEIFIALAENNEVRIFEACIDDDVVACRLSFVLGKSIYLYYTGYDPHWREYNVGSLMTFRIIQWALENNYSEINLSAGKDHSKLRWHPAEYLLQGGVRIGSGFRGKVASRYYDEVSKLRLKRILSRHNAKEPP